MSYDELEEKFYILSHRISELERENTSLKVKTNDLEARNIIAENTLAKTEARHEYAAKMYQDETYKTINLKVRLEALEKERDELKEELAKPQSEVKALLARSALINDPFIMQEYANLRDRDALPKLPGFSIHEPMMLTPMPVQVNTKHIVLQQTDVMGFMRNYNAMQGNYELHAYAKCDDKVMRYCTQTSMFDLSRREDFAVVLKQMTEGLQELMIHEYSKRDF